MADQLAQLPSSTALLAGTSCSRTAASISWCTYRLIHSLCYGVSVISNNSSNWAVLAAAHSRHAWLHGSPDAALPHLTSAFFSARIWNRYPAQQRDGPQRTKADTLCCAEDALDMHVEVPSSSLLGLQRPVSYDGAWRELDRLHAAYSKQQHLRQPLEPGCRRITADDLQRAYHALVDTHVQLVHKFREQRQDQERLRQQEALERLQQIRQQRDKREWRDAVIAREIKEQRYLLEQRRAEKRQEEQPGRPPAQSVHCELAEGVLVEDSLRQAAKGWSEWLWGKFFWSNSTA